MKTIIILFALNIFNIYNVYSKSENINVVKIHSSHKYIIVNIGKEDGYQMNQQAIFYKNNKKIAVGKIIKIRPYLSTWKIFRIHQRFVKRAEYKLRTSNDKTRSIASTPKNSKKSKFKIKATTSYEIVDNYFELSKEDIEQYKEMDSEDIANGHFDNIDSLTEKIVSQSLELNYKTRNKIKFIGGIQYNKHLENKIGSNLKFKLGIEKEFKKSSIKVGFKSVSDKYKKNYISRVIDKNNNGNISKNEKEYSKAIYNEQLIDLKANQHLLSNFYLTPQLSFEKRSFNEPFINRDRNKYIAGVGLKYSKRKKYSFHLRYSLEQAKSSNGKELILIDETIDGTDLNDDGNIKEKAVLISNIDRSSKRQIINASVSLYLTKKFKVFTQYKITNLQYTTNNSLDTDRYNKTKLLKQLSVGFNYKITKKLSIKSIYEQNNETFYKNNSFLLSISIDF